MFLTQEEKTLSTEFLSQGFVVRQVADRAALDWIREQFVRLISSSLNLVTEVDPNVLLNEIHQRVPVKHLNAFRLEIIKGFNSIDGLRERYFQVARPYLEALVGNELAMQLRVNLSIQLPGDDSSLLPIHADTWSGDSPYEVVVWLPLVNCYGTKAMYLLPPKSAAKLNSDFTAHTGKSSEELYQNLKNEVVWLNVSYGQVLLFDQSLPHGNRVNDETETRWSMNCRFKGVFTPYGDKKLGEFFEPITLRAASRNGMDYQLPKT